MIQNFILNAALLVTLATFHNLLTRALIKGKLWAKLVSGLLYGSVAIIGMHMPLRYAPGVIYDGRSIILVISGLFGGSTIAMVSVIVAGAYRIFLSGNGVWAGLSTIISCALTGLAFRKLIGNRPEKLSILSLLGIGIVAHVAMLACQLLVIPWPAGIKVIGRIWGPIMLVFPITTMLMGILLRDAERRIHGEIALFESEERLELVLEGSHLGYWDWDIEADKVYRNARWAEMLGYSLDEMVYTVKQWTDLLHPDDKERVWKSILDHLEGRIPEHRMEYRMRAKDGQYKWILDQAGVVKWNAEGKPLRMCGTHTDITTRKQIEEALKESEERFRMAQAIGHVGNWEYNLQTTYFWGSDEAKRIYGFDLDQTEISEESVESCAPERKRVHQALVDLIEKGIPYNLEFEIHPINSTQPKIINSVAELVRDKQGKPLKVLGVIQDITARKQAEDALRDSETQFRTLFENATEGILMTDIETKKFVYINPAMCQLLGYSKEEMEQMSVKDIHPKAYKDHVLEEFDTIVRGDKNIVERIPCLRKDGVIRFVDIRTSKMKIRGQEFLVGFFSDVTKRKEAEEALQKSERKFAAAFYESNIVMTLSELESGCFIDVNNNFCEWSGYSQSEIFGKTAIELGLFKDMHDRQLLVGTLLKDGSIKDIEIDCYRRNGEKRRGLFSSTYIELEERLYLFSTMVDITERKLAEEALSQKSALLEAQLNSSIDGILVVDREGKKLIQNKRLVELWKIPKEIADNPYDQIQVNHVMNSTQNPDEFISKVRYLYDHPDEKSWDEVILKDGKILARYSSPVIGSDGKNFGRIWSFRDITENKRAEEALRDSEKTFRELIDGMNDTVWILDFNGNLLDVNKMAVQLLDYSKEELLSIGLYGIDSSLKKKQIQALARTMSFDQVKIFETFFKPKNGNLFPVEINSSLVNYFGQKAILSVARDITIRKKTETALRESEERLRVATEVTQIGIWDWDVENDIWYASPTYYTMLGYQPVIGYADRTVWLQRVHPDDMKAVAGKIRVVLDGIDNSYQYEARMKHADGSYRWHSVIGSTVERNKHGKPIRMMGVRIDITELKLAEQALRQSEERKTIQNQIAHVFLFVPDEEMYGKVLEIVRLRMKSKFGIFGVIAKNGDLVIPSMTEGIWNKNHISEKSVVLPPNMWGKSIWGRAIREKKTFSSDGPFHFPEGHIHFDHVLTVPIIFRNETIGILSVANKDHSYHEEDIDLMQNIVDYISPILHARLQRDMEERERKRAEEQILKDLDEKGVLLREIHHRVKNNLSVVSSLLNLQARQVKTKQQALEAFKESRDRVFAMALVHEKLYQSNDFASVDIKSYLDGMSNQLMKIYNIQSNIKLILDIENIKIDINSAIPTGLILNELVTNAFKYAFPDGREGKIIVSLKFFETDFYELIVSDNGIGIPQNINPMESKSLGLNLIQVLTEQLNATWTFSRDHGTTFRIIIPKSGRKNSFLFHSS